MSVVLGMMSLELGSENPNTCPSPTCSFQCCSMCDMSMRVYLSNYMCVSICYPSVSNDCVCLPL